MLIYLVFGRNLILVNFVYNKKLLKMNGLSIETIGREMVIRLNKDSFSDIYLLSLIRRLTLEELAKKADFDEKVLEIAEEIDQQWWTQNGEEFLKDVRK
jgi:hypothetical protein